MTRQNIAVTAWSIILGASALASACDGGRRDEPLVGVQVVAEEPARPAPEPLGQPQPD